MTLRASAEEERANISVRDTGIGIDSVHRDRVFERFFRVPNAGSVPVGSGLGLSLAKWIAVRHGTQLRVESAPGQGSCFSFSLKRSDAGLPASHDSTVTSGLGIKL